ncbi:redoxin domain-containing protein [Victivallis vadensis]|uniref:redoxin domain-containing protein n=1 Tax=Victivallis vadensis TaxID=172901 RepID=UPI0026DDC81F|nr:redoxin domain-containing protein [Victivallis vadensis]
MKNSLKLFVAAAAALFCIFSAPGATLETGAEVPELDLRAWLSGKPVNLADLKGKKHAVLFFWTIGQRSLDVFPRIIATANKFGEKELQFIGIAPDSPEAVDKFIRNQPLPFPVAADNILKTLYTYMRPNDQVPLAAVIDKSGKLLWRGRPEYLDEVLPEILSGKYDLKGNIEREKFSQAVMSAMKIKDYPTVRKLVDAELEKHPDNLELLTLKINLTGTLMNDIDTAEKTAEAGLKQLPRNLKLYEQLIRALHQAGADTRLPVWFDRLVADFGDQPAVLIRFARQELSQPVGKLRVENAYKLTHAAYNAPKFADDRQKGQIAREYAGVLYYCGRPDKALEVAKVSMQLLKDSPNPKEYETAKDLVVYYNTVLRMSRAIR